MLLICEQVNLLGSCVPMKGMMGERNVCWTCVPFTGTHEPNKVTCSHLSGFLGPRALHFIAEVMDLNPVEDT